MKKHILKKKLNAGHRSSGRINMLLFHVNLPNLIGLAEQSLFICFSKKIKTLDFRLRMPFLYTNHIKCLLCSEQHNSTLLMQFQVHKGRERLCLKMNRSSESNFLCTHSIRQHSNRYLYSQILTRPTTCRTKTHSKSTTGSLKQALEKIWSYFPSSV